MYIFYDSLLRWTINIYYNLSVDYMKQCYKIYYFGLNIKILFILYGPMISARALFYNVREILNNFKRTSSGL